ncbi:MAG: hypothetical protein IT306_04515 [Chloroflexi bacterium]|nr:hypothetical protein [Chloroflexota bacterium]
MTELSTADLAGGMRPRPQQTVPADRPDLDDDRSDLGMQPGMREPRHDAATDGASGTASTRSQSMPTRSSTLANPAATDGADTDGAEPLFPTGEAEGFRSRWTEVQTGFVDEPRHAVEQADSMVAEMMQRLAHVFAEERAKLEEQWSRGDDISTEDLRQALRRYRSFFDRLLQV